jgi:hypothetical protein
MEPHAPRERPAGVTALAFFFLAGAGIAGISAVSLALPGSPLEPMWRLNPRARIAFSGLGLWAVAILVPVSLACAFASAGFFKGARWGYRLGLGILCVNLLGDTLNTILGIEPRAAFGIPIALGLVAYLRTKKVRRFFGAIR